MDLNDWGAAMSDTLGMGKPRPLRTALAADADAGVIARAWLDASRKEAVAFTRLREDLGVSLNRRLSRAMNLADEAAGLLEMLVERVDEHPGEAQAALDAAGAFVAKWTSKEAAS